MELQPRRKGSSTKTKKHDKSIAGLYDMERSLGSGHFAVVKLARHVFTGEQVAIKVIDKTKLNDVEKDHLYQEVRCMKLVQHPNVVRLYEVIDTQSKLYLILEYGDGGDMYDHIMKHEGQGINEDKARHYFKQIVSAIDYCHKLHVVHRDLKPENVIFFKSQDLAKLTDFGFSNSYRPGEKLFTSCGSLAYSAPEILLGESYDAPAVDVWSIGVILYMMVCGRGPFSHANDSETLTMIMDCKYDLPDTLSQECKNLISRMLVRRPGDRPTLDSIINDEWVTSGDLEAKSLSPAPLISEISISKEIHILVLQKMEIGKIASKEEVESSLNQDEYDHVTATYFLIAERILKKRHGFAALHVKLESRHSYPYEYLANRQARSEADTPAAISNEDINSNNTFNTSEYHHSYPVTNDLTKEQSQSDECLADNSVAYHAEFQLKPRSHRLTYPMYGMAKSSPNLLNEISEEHESEMEESPRSSPHLQRRSSQRRRAKYHTCRLSPIHSRRSSCSSSDDDEYMLSEKRRLSAAGHHILSASNVQTESSSPQEQDTQENGGGGGTDESLTKIMNLLNTDDLQNATNLTNLFLPILNSKLSGVTYGRHLSDTNLTSYSMQLQLALAKGNFKPGKYQHSKCSSDTNLVSTLCKKKQNMLISSELLRPKDFIFKYMKCGRTSKNSSSLSLSSPIVEEELDSKSLASLANDSTIMDGFSDLNSESVLSCTEQSNHQESRRNSFFSTDNSVKYQPGDEPTDSAENKAEIRSAFIQNPVHNIAQQVSSGSVCCSLV